MLIARKEAVSAKNDHGLVAPSDIADLANVSRAAVSNWRRRHPDFPTPDGGTKAKPLFSRTAVERWLIANGHKIQQEAADLSVWALLNRFRDEISPRETRSLVLSVLCARKLADGTEDVGRLREAASQGRVLDALIEIARRPGTDPRWGVVVTADLESLIDRQAARPDSGPPIDRLASELFGLVQKIDVAELADVADHVLGRVASTEGRTAGEHGAVGSHMARLLARAATGNTIAATAYDPACGIGETLVQLWKTRSPNSELHLVGTDINREYALVCRQRCFLYGANATIECGDVLTRDPHLDLRADVVVTEPPFGLDMPTDFNLSDPRWAIAGPPPKGNSETAWIQHAIYHLAPSRRGFVVTSLGSLSGANSASIRRALVRQGCIEAVVTLPRKLVNYTSIPTALWVVRSPNPREPLEQLTFINASQLDPAEDFPISLWLSHPEGSEDTRVLWARISVEDVLADDPISLDPRRWTQTSVDTGDIVHRHRMAKAKLQTAIATIGEAITLPADVTSLASQIVNVRTLEHQGLVRITRGRGVRIDKGTPTHPDIDADADAANPELVTIRMIREGTLPPLPARLELWTGFGIDEQNVARSNTDRNYTDPGDVLVITLGNIRAVVDETGGRILGAGVFRVAVDHQHFEPNYFAGCLNGSWNERFEWSPSTVRRADLLDLEIPLIPREDQVRIAEQIRQTQAIGAAGWRIAQASDELTATWLEAVRFGVSLSDEQGGVG
jgi:hypothetical protein